MRVLTAEGRSVAVSPPGITAGLFGHTPASGAGSVGSVRLARGPTGRPSRVTYAQIARANPWVVSAVGGRAGPASRVSMHVQRPDPQNRPGHRERVRPGDGGPGSVLAALMENPEDRVSGRRFRRRLLGDGLVHANGLIELVRSGGSLVGLRWQPWADLDPVLSDDGLVLEAVKVPLTRDLNTVGRLLRTSEMRVLDRADFIHLAWNDDTESPLGVSPLASLHYTHALHDAALRFAVAYMDNGVFPSGMVEVPPTATTDQLAATRRLIQALYAGPDRAGEPFVGFGKWHQIMATPEGARLVELAQLSHEEVGAAFRTPLSQLGDTRETNKATSDSDRTRFVRDVVGEDVGILESEFNAQLVAPNRRWSSEGIVIEAQLAEMLRPDFEAMADVIEKEVGGPVATANEARKWIGLPPITDDDNADRLQLKPGTPERAVSST